MDRHRPPLRRRPGLEPLEGRRLPATTTLTVTTAADSGAGSLRQALLDASSPKAPTNYQVDFAIPGPGVHTIRPASSLPAVPSNTTISGWTQPGYSGTPLIEINGSKAGTYRAPNQYVEGLVVGGGDGIYGLAIDGFAGDQVLVAGRNAAIQGDYIGVDPTGESAPGNDQAGVSVLGGGNVLIGGPAPGQRDVISGNHWGVFAANSSQVVVAGNAIGLDASGTKAIGNAFAGVEFVGTHDSTIGGPSAASANQVGGSGYGIYLTSAAAGPYDFNDQIAGNALGLTAAGGPAPNTAYDLFLDFSTNRNTVSNNTFGAISGSTTASPLPVVRDVNPANTYSSNVGFDASKRQVNVGVTSTYSPTKSANNRIYSFKATFQVTNHGPQAATDVVLVIDLGANASFEAVGYEPTSGTFDPAFAQGGASSTYLVQFGTLASGQTASITLNCVNPSGIIAGHLAGSVSSDGIDATSGDKSTQPL